MPAGSPAGTLSPATDRRQDLQATATPAGGTNPLPARTKDPCMKWILVVYALTYSTPEPDGFRVPTDFPTRTACEFWGAKVPQHGDAAVLDGSGNLIVVPPIGFECRPSHQA